MFGSAAWRRITCRDPTSVRLFTRSGLINSHDCATATGTSTRTWLSTRILPANWKARPCRTSLFAIPKSHHCPNNVFQVPVSDFGDAPDDLSEPRYPTLLAHDGARHTIGSLFLGTTVDDEPDGQPTASADGDDVNGVADDDGVVTLASLVATSIFNTTTASLSAVASDAGKLGWVDRFQPRR